MLMFSDVLKIPPKSFHKFPNPRISKVIIPGSRLPFITLRFLPSPLPHSTPQSKNDSWYLYCLITTTAKLQNEIETKTVLIRFWVEFPEHCKDLNFYKMFIISSNKILSHSVNLNILSWNFITFVKFYVRSFFIPSYE